MLKLEELSNYTKDFFTERYVINQLEILKEYEKNKEKINGEFLNVLHKLFQKCNDLQDKNKKNHIAILHICYLYSACLTRKYELQINLYDKRFYLDKVEISNIWIPEFIYKYYEQDMELFEKKAQQNVFGFGHMQMQEIRMKIIKAYHLITLNYLHSMIQGVYTDTEFIKMQKENEFIVLFGGYMEESIPIMKLNNQTKETVICDTL